MDTVENQKVIIVQKSLTDTDNLYTKINLEAINEAMRILKGNNFKLWLYIAKNKDQYKFALSRIDFCRCANVTKPTYLSAVKDLMDKGYLVPKGDGSNVYTFFEGGMVVPTEDDVEIEYNEGKNTNKNFVF